MKSKDQLRFEKKFVKTDSCWEWQPPRDKHGYGEFWLNGANYSAHRVSYELYVAPIPRGMCILHSCDNRRCVNPAHLSPGTPAENARQMKERGRSLSSIAHPRCRISPEVVKAIRKDTRRLKEIAAEYKVSVAQAGKIRRRIARTYD